MEVVSSMESWDRECGRRGRGIRGYGVLYMWRTVHGFQEEGYELGWVVRLPLYPGVPRRPIPQPPLKVWG